MQNNSSNGCVALVNANLTEHERKHDVNHQYEKHDGYCVKCGHYKEVHYNATECECDCHE